MPEETPTKRIIEDPRVNSTVTYTQSTMKIERRVNNMLYGGMLFLGLLAIIAILVFQPKGQYVFFVFPAAILVFAGISETSYFCDIDKINCQILRRRSGILGTPFGKMKSVFSFDDVECLTIQQMPNRRYDTFRVRLVLKNGVQLDMPSETSLKGCMEYATLYRDFLEISAPLKLPE